MRNGELKNGILISDNHVNAVNYYDKNKEIRLNGKESSLTQQNFIRNILDSLNNEPDHILPKNTKFYKRFGDIALYLIEWDPSIRTIYFDKDMSSEYQELVSTGKDQYLENTSKSQERFILSFPYIIWTFVVNLKTFSIIKNDFFFKLTPLESLYDYLIFPPLTNILPSQGFETIESTCFGPNRNHKPEDNIQELIENKMNLFFKNSFNDDYNSVYTKYRDYKESTLSNIFLWEHKTKNDPYFIFDDKWIYTKYNLKEIIESNFRILNLDKPEEHINLFGLTKRNVKTTYKNKPLVYTYDSHLEKFISPNCVISVGDDIMINDRICYVESFAYNFNGEDLDGEDLDLMTVEYEDTGETEELILDEEKRNEIKKYFEENSRLTKLERLELDNGDIIKPGDFILNKNNPMGQFLKIEKIIKSNDGIIEITTANNHKFVPNNKLVKFSYKNLCSLFGGKLRRGTILSLVNPKKYLNTFYPQVNFLKTISFKGFKLINGNRIAIKTNDRYNDTVDSFNNLNIPDCTEVNKPAFKHGLFIYSVMPENDGKSYIYSNKNKNLIYVFGKTSSSVTERFKNSLYHAFKDGNLNLPSTDGCCDINLNIGDEVIYSDWDDINEMMKIRKIISFDFYSSPSSIDFRIDENSDVSEVRDLINSKNSWTHVNINTVDEDSNERSFKYIQKLFHYNDSGSIIHSPTIRKVIRNYNDFNVGDKVKAKAPKIYGFPKKDVNKIVAFINDTGCEYPLALMSNTYTIRCNDLENYFEKVNGDIEISNVRNPNLNKQNGDMEILIDRTDDLFVIKVQTVSKKLLLVRKGYNVKASTCMRRPYGFLNPKFDSLCDSIDEIKYPNFMNWIKTAEESE